MLQLPKAKHPAEFNQSFRQDLRSSLTDKLQAVYLNCDLCHAEVILLYSTAANPISASAGPRCFASVEKLLVSVTQQGEQYRGLWKGRIIPGASLMVFAVSIGC